MGRKLLAPSFCTITIISLSVSVIGTLAAEASLRRQVWWSHFAATKKPLYTDEAWDQTRFRDDRNIEDQRSKTKYDPARSVGLGSVTDKENLQSSLRYQTKGNYSLSDKQSQIYTANNSTAGTLNNNRRVVMLSLNPGSGSSLNRTKHQDSRDSYDANKISGLGYQLNGFHAQPPCPCEEKFLERIQDLERKVNDMFLDSDKLTTRMVEAIDSVEKFLATGGSQVDKQRQIVSFSVLTSKNIPHLSESEVLKFDEVLVNNGGAYDQHTGIFRAPLPGVYLFSASILSGYNSTIETMITLNGHDASRIYSGAFNNRGYGSNTVILNLRKGDEVAVAVFYGNGNYVHGKWSTFSGTLIETY